MEILLDCQRPPLQKVVHIKFYENLFVQNYGGVSTKSFAIILFNEAKI